MYDIVFVVTPAHPVIVLFGAVYRQVVLASQGLTDVYDPPVGFTPAKELHAVQVAVAVLLFDVKCSGSAITV